MSIFVAMRYALLLIVALICAGCGRENALPDEPERPGAATPIESVRAFYFAESNITDIAAESDTVEFCLVVLRGDVSEAESLQLTSTPACRMSKVYFAAGQSRSTAEVSIDVADISANAAKEYTFSISEADRTDDGPAEWRVRVSRPVAEAVTQRGARYRICGQLREVELRLTEIDGGRIIEVKASDFKRTIHHVGSTVRVECEGGYDDYAACRSAAEERERRKAEGRWCDYAFGLNPSFSEADMRYNMLLAYEKADGTVVPAVEYLLMTESGEWVDCGTASYTDGWFLPRLSYNALYFLPDEYPWQVWLQWHKDNPQRLRVIDLYRSTSPLSVANDAPLGTTTEILLGTDGKVDVAAQVSPFQNSDFFGAVVYIWGDEGRLSINEHGDTAIVIGKPMYRAGLSGPWERQPGTYEAKLEWTSVEH